MTKLTKLVDSNKKWKTFTNSQYLVYLQTNKQYIMNQQIDKLLGTQLQKITLWQNNQNQYATL